MGSIAWAVVAMAMSCTASRHPAMGQESSGQTIEAFIEPYRHIAVSSPEMGVIDNILVKEGNEVSRKQLLVRLDDRILTAALEVARSAKDATGAKRAAEADLAIKKDQMAGYRRLMEKGNATQRELDRCEGDHQQAIARLQSVQEELELRRLEYERVRVQIQQRQIESPIEGYVAKIEKEVGEFVSPHDPVLMHLVELRTLKAVFSVPFESARQMKAGARISLDFGTGEMTSVCTGVIEFVSPVADAESASVSVKVRIDNEDRMIPSGVMCRWDLTQLDSIEQPSQARSVVPLSPR